LVQGRNPAPFCPPKRPQKAKSAAFVWLHTAYDNSIEDYRSIYAISIATIPGDGSEENVSGYTT